MKIYLSLPFAIGQPGLPIALTTHVPAQDMKTLVGRRNLLGLRNESLAAVGLVELMQTFGHRDHWGVPEAIGVLVCSPSASVEAVGEVNALCVDDATRTVSILDAPNVSPNVVSAVASIRAKVHGPCFTIDDEGGQVDTFLDLAAALLHTGAVETILGIETSARDGVATGVGFIVSAWPSAFSSFEISWNGCLQRSGVSFVELAIACGATMRKRPGVQVVIGEIAVTAARFAS